MPRRLVVCGSSGDSRAQSHAAGFVPAFTEHLPPRPGPNARWKALQTFYDGCEWRGIPAQVRRVLVGTIPAERRPPSEPTEPVANSNGNIFRPPPQMVRKRAQESAPDALRREKDGALSSRGL